MNIFAIESDATGNIDWHKSALSHDNFRVNKMIIESCQMLSTNAQLMGETTRYRMSFQNHPSTIWARSSSANFLLWHTLLNLYVTSSVAATAKTRTAAMMLSST